MVVFLTNALAVALWSNRPLWGRASAAIPGLASWSFFAVLLLLLALVIVVPTIRPRAVELGLAPTQLVAALGVGAAMWATYHVVELVDIACDGRSPPPKMDVIGDVLGCYAEELIYRVVALGAIATALGRRMSQRRAIVIAVVGSSLLFWLSHLPRDLVMGDIADPFRIPTLVGEGLLMSAVYLSTGNAMIAGVLHALGDGPMLVFAGTHHVVFTSAANAMFCIALVLWYQRRLPRTSTRR